MLLLLIKDVKVVKLRLFSQLDLCKNSYLYFCIMRALLGLASDFCNIYQVTSNCNYKGRDKLEKIATECTIAHYYDMEMMYICSDDFQKSSL